MNNSRLRSVRNWTISSAGSSSVEYAILAALVIGIFVVASRFLGGGVEQAFARVLTDNQQQTVVDESQPAENTPSPAMAQSGHSDLRLLMAEGIAIIALGGWWFVVHRDRLRKPEEESSPESLEQGLFKQNHLYKKRQQIFKVLAEDLPTVLESRMLVAHVMSTNIASVTPQTACDRVIAMMDDREIRHLLVVNGQGRLVGIISDRDKHREGCKNASEMMTPNPLTVTPTTLISPAVTLMMDRRISCLPVVDEESGHPLAVLTTTDLMMALQCSLQILHKVAAEIAPIPLAAENEPAEVESSKSWEPAASV